MSISHPTKAEREFEAGFNDAFTGKDCQKVTNEYVAGYMKGREVAKSTGRPMFETPLSASTKRAGHWLTA